MNKAQTLLIEFEETLHRDAEATLAKFLRDKNLASQTLPADTLAGLKALETLYRGLPRAAKHVGVIPRQDIEDFILSNKPEGREILPDPHKSNPAAKILNWISLFAAAALLLVIFQNWDLTRPMPNIPDAPEKPNVTIVGKMFDRVIVEDNQTKTPYALREGELWGSCSLEGIGKDNVRFLCSKEHFDIAYKPISSLPASSPALLEEAGKVGGLWIYSDLSQDKKNQPGELLLSLDATGLPLMDFTLSITLFRVHTFYGKSDEIAGVRFETVSHRIEEFSKLQNPILPLNVSYLNPGFYLLEVAPCRGLLQTNPTLAKTIDLLKSRHYIHIGTAETIEHWSASDASMQWALRQMAPKEDAGLPTNAEERIQKLSAEIGRVKSALQLMTDIAFSQFHEMNRQYESLMTDPDGQDIYADSWRFNIHQADLALRDGCKAWATRNWREAADADAKSLGGDAPMKLRLDQILSYVEFAEASRLPTMLEAYFQNIRSLSECYIQYLRNPRDGSPLVQAHLLSLKIIELKREIDANWLLLENKLPG